MMTINLTGLVIWLVVWGVVFYFLPRLRAKMADPWGTGLFVVLIILCVLTFLSVIGLHSYFLRIG